MTVTIPRYFYGDELIARSDEYEELLRLLREAELIYPSSALPFDYESFADESDLVRSTITKYPELEPIADGKQLMSVDAPIYPADYTAHDHSIPLVSQSSVVADRLINSSALRPLVDGCERTVNIVIADNGLTQAFRDASGWQGEHFTGEVNGLPVSIEPTVAQAATKHANLMALVARRYNEHAVIWDMPILPQRIDDVPSFTSVATAHFKALLEQVRDDKGRGKDESWILVCAWSLVDTSFEAGILQYHDDRRHLLSQRILELVAEGIDVVFAAGNLGQFYPAQGAGHYDIGPCRSIFGANGLPEVLTVGAVDPTGTWIGASSQGVEGRYLRVTKVGETDTEASDPGPRKPDLCAPSWFYLDQDPLVAVTGTSGSCAVAAAVIAAVRRCIGANTMPPAQLIEAMRATASGRVTADTDERATAESWRLGNGFIDCEALVAALP